MTPTVLRRTLFLIAILVAWEAAYRIIGWEEWKFPSLFQTVEAFYNGFAHGQLLDAILNSLRRLLIAFAISISVGLLLGFMFARSKVIDDTLGFVVIALQTVPSIAWLPFAIIWFGFNDKSVIFITALGATWTMAIATRTGIKNISPIYIRAAQTLGTGTGWRMFTQILIPGAFPHLMTGIRVAWAFAWRALVAGELIANGAGLGQLLQDGRGLGDTALMLTVVIIIAVLGTLSDHFCFKKLEDKLLIRYGLENQSK
ncbi:NitT/TauT family transport system permease protein [Paenibacillus endophyticus]|uniref:NitT/TauT family transport system permease protein n=1 Tax=Paenibacillus endophyticus TaxID=1294268 RepID=A0A7W5G8J5_9BACL|nr:ABC transporter permease [Paenibacillus endophyticus]MBB3150730.1 NitT/TauT family transport system permease protein [Paenibacillus endophyticus]